MRGGLPYLAAALTAFLALAPAARAATVSVLYAGSLIAMMEHAVGPAFDRVSGYHFEGFAGGSRALANQIKGKLRRADVFISASPSVNATLMEAPPTAIGCAGTVDSHSRRW